MEVHPFHNSVTEMTYNARDQVWEISLRLFQDDLEQTMSAVVGKKFLFQSVLQKFSFIDIWLTKSSIDVKLPILFILFLFLTPSKF